MSDHVILGYSFLHPKYGQRVFDRLARQRSRLIVGTFISYCLIKRYPYMLSTCCFASIIKYPKVGHRYYQIFRPALFIYPFLEYDFTFFRTWFLLSIYYFHFIYETLLEYLFINIKRITCLHLIPNFAFGTKLNF